MLSQHRGVEEAPWEYKDMMRARYPFLFEDGGMWFSHLVSERLLYMHVILCICVCEFWDEILLRGGECETLDKVNR